MTNDSSEDERIHFMKIIFLPFNPIFKFIVLCVVLLKVILGPIQSIYPFFYCEDIVIENQILWYLTLGYGGFSDFIYCIDFFLSILHRQLRDEAEKHLAPPKEFYKLILDFVCLFPFYRFLVQGDCMPIQLWPNIILFNEFLVIYRVVEYFNLFETHSTLNLLLGYTLLLVSLTNCFTCLLLLLTENGLCAKCTSTTIYDWRIYVLNKFPDLESMYTKYICAAALCLSYIVDKVIDEIKPATIMELIFGIVMFVLIYTLHIFVVIPKVFAEYILRLRGICEFHPRVKRIIEETRRRNPSTTAYKNVEKFYKLIWKKHNGITSMPEVISELPRYLRVEIRFDLVWQVFHHSPTLRNTSAPYQRWLSKYIRLDHKLPQERFFVGLHCNTNLYYLKSGVVQFISYDDSVSPILSVTGGTIFGDICFYIPPLKRNVLVHCLTYCEIFIVPREAMLKSLHMFPEDRLVVLRKVWQRINHAHSLYDFKVAERGLTRSENEDLEWIKHKWWQIAGILEHSKKTYTKEQLRNKLPREHESYHCVKYIGQLVLCNSIMMRSKTIFANTDFPWLFSPNNKFMRAWRYIMQILVCLVVILYPPNLSIIKKVYWFTYLESTVNIFYGIDIVLSLLTVQENEKPTVSVCDVMKARSQTRKFILNFFATIWLEQLAIISGAENCYNICKFNRLIRIHALFPKDITSMYDKTDDPMNSIFYKLMLINFCFIYIGGFFLYNLLRFLPSDIKVSYFFSYDDLDGSLSIFLAWVFQLLFNNAVTTSKNELISGILLRIIIFMLAVYTRIKFSASLYLKYRQKTNYHYFVCSLKKFYLNIRIHPDLLRRMDKYLNCHWKYFNGMEVTHPNVLGDEPPDVYWKFHGAVAQNVIATSKLMRGASSDLIKELGYESKFLILPKGSSIILFGAVSKLVIWIVNGYVMSEYMDDNNQTCTQYFSREDGKVYSVGALFLGSESLRNYVAATDCEILFINTETFFRIFKRYPEEWKKLKRCMNEVKDKYALVFRDYLMKHKNYKQMVLTRHGRFSGISRQNLNAEFNATSRFDKFKHFIDWPNPESRMIKTWMFIRMLTVIVHIFCHGVRAGSGANMLYYLRKGSQICHFIEFVDIIFKLILPYYDERGIIITCPWKCARHYMTRAFIADVIAAMPSCNVSKFLFNINLPQNESLMIALASRYTQLYLVTGYFNYFADKPTTNLAFIMIIKWQIVILLCAVGSCAYFTMNCIDFYWNARGDLVSMEHKNCCWAPTYLHISSKPTMDQLHLIYAESISMAQCALTRVNLGMINVSRHMLGVAILFILLGMVFWYIMCYCLTLLVLKYRGDTLFQHGLSQLSDFLKYERVEAKVISKVEHHFKYWWFRTQGLNIQSILTDRIGAIFREDLNYYFYKETFQALDTMLEAGEAFQRELCNYVSTLYCLPKEDIVREMDAINHIYIVHRGTVSVKQNGKELGIIRKGGLFGQLDGGPIRPIHITVTSVEHSDVLHLLTQDFNKLINKAKIASKIIDNLNSKNDFMRTKKEANESAYTSLSYILRKSKSIKLPWMNEPANIKSSPCYQRWLTFSLFISPTIGVILTLLLPVAHNICLELRKVIFVFDICHLFYMISELYSIHVVVVKNECIRRYAYPKRIRSFIFYVDVISLIASICGAWVDLKECHLFRLWRLRHYFDFYRHFCKNFNNRISSIILKFIMVLLFLHLLTCGWIWICCRKYESEPFPAHNYPMPKDINDTIDYNEWLLPHQRPGACARLTPSRRGPYDEKQVWHVVTSDSGADYILSLTYIFILHTHTNMDIMTPLSIAEIYYKVFITFSLYLAEMWISSVTISAVYTKYRDMYQYSYRVANLVMYLRQNGLSQKLLRSVIKYTKLLWRRQKGCWLPEITLHAPLCLQEDILSELYIHHLRSPAVFRELPDYFLRQLVVHLKRTVIFPGKYIVQEGDIYPCIYFIHEGEVEKWYTDPEGDLKMLSLLTMNGYFGLVPGLYPDTPFRFSYYSRTVVDLIYLKHYDWQDLLNIYPEVKASLYDTAGRMIRSSL